ncbi:MAG: Uma2 family endonuclease, partial [Dehalococcoidia bacterium]
TMPAHLRPVTAASETVTLATVPVASEYPEGDGKPMAESRLHVEALMRLILIFQERYRQRPDVLVCGNIFLFYVEGEPNKRLSPDVFVALGVPRDPIRPSYYLWEMGKAPDVVFEVTSKSTRGADRGKKQRIYESIGVKEYFLYDPLRDWVRAGLQGYRLRAAGYEPIVADAGGGLVSEVLAVRLVAEGGLLQCYDLKTGERLLSPAERAGVEAGRAGVEARRAEAEAARAEAEAARADGEAEGRRHEAAARQVADLRVAELQRRLDELEGRSPS